MEWRRLNNGVQKVRWISSVTGDTQVEETLANIGVSRVEVMLDSNVGQCLLHGIGHQ